MRAARVHSFAERANASGSIATVIRKASRWNVIRVLATTPHMCAQPFCNYTQARLGGSNETVNPEIRSVRKAEAISGVRQGLQNVRCSQ
jgi:hypothetical protein